MKVTIDIYKVAASGRVELEAEKVEEAKNTALAMARGHSVLLSPPKDEFVAVVAKAINSTEGK